MQNIVYGEFLPTVLGAKVMKKYDLLAEETSKVKKKALSVDYSITWG